MHSFCIFVLRFAVKKAFMANLCGLQQENIGLHENCNVKFINNIKDSITTVTTDVRDYEIFT